MTSNARTRSYVNRLFIAITGVLSLLIVLPNLISAQEGDFLLESEQPDSLENGLYGGGLTFIDGDTYVRLQLQPDIPIGQVGIGLDLILLYNPYAADGDPLILAEDGENWDNPSTWLRLIRYVRYGQPYDPFHLRFGALDYLTIGHGSIMSGYSNYDRRGVRLNFRNAENRYGVETMVNDIGNPTIFGGRAFLRPFQRAENNNLLTRFELGGTYLTDINPNLQTIGETPLNAVGLDAGFPIFETGTFRLDIYDDLTFLNTLPEGGSEPQIAIPVTEARSVTSDLAWGNAVGIGFSFTQMLFKVEYRTFGEGYIPSVFDYTYESAKSLAPQPDMPQFLGLDLNTDPRRGFFSQLVWHPLPQIHLLGALEDYTNSDPKLYIGVTESGLVPGLSGRAFYTKRDIGDGGQTNFFGDLFDLDEKSAFSVEIQYEIAPPLVTIITREYRFRRVETPDGSSRFEPIHKTSFTVGVSTDF